MFIQVLQCFYIVLIIFLFQLNTLILNTALVSNTRLTGFLLTGTCNGSPPEYCHMCFATLTDAFVRPTPAKPVGMVGSYAANKIREIACIATFEERDVCYVGDVRLNYCYMFAVYRKGLY